MEQSEDAQQPAAQHLLHRAAPAQACRDQHRHAATRSGPWPQLHRSSSWTRLRAVAHPETARRCLPSHCWRDGPAARASPAPAQGTGEVCSELRGYAWTRFWGSARTSFFLGAIARALACRRSEVLWRMLGAFDGLSWVWPWPFGRPELGRSTRHLLSSWHASGGLGDEEGR